jgi:energy-coupling factor transport system substrate-specific component
MLEERLAARYTTWLGHVLTLLLSSLGAAAFSYPFWLTLVPQATSTTARVDDAPLIFGLFMPLLLLLIIAEIGSRHINAKIVAALGVLTAINAVLRFPVGLGDSPTFFFLPILLGYAYGARFGFLHGALSLLVSALLTAGIGPWLPFQMFAMGWLGMGAAALRALRLRAGSWFEVCLLAAYGYGACMLFGALMNLYFWPFLGAESGLGWQPDLSLAQTFGRYWTFYVVSGSLAWDALRAVSTATLLLVLGRPVLRLLRRFWARFFWQTYSGTGEQAA